MSVDLHCHTVFSVDAFGEPIVRIERALELGLSAISITEHNSLGSTACSMAAASAAGLRYIPGVELDLTWGPEECHRSHFLCYGFDPENQDLLQFVARSNSVYDRQADIVLSFLAKEACGFDRNAFENHLRAIHCDNPQPSLWRIADYVAQAELLPHGMQKREFTKRMAEQVPWNFPSLAQAGGIVHSAGGLVLMAHPRRVFPDREDTRFLDELITSGSIDGFEISHPSSTGDRKLLELCKRHDCAVSGGSDCHDPVLSMNDANVSSIRGQFGLIPPVQDDVLESMERTTRKLFGRGMNY